MLLLDFSKAYDSVNRLFLYEALKWHGYPPAFIRVIQALHKGTTARFRAEGHLSAEIDMVNGIRLAPLLFILSMDTLFDASNHPHQHLES